MANEHLRTAAMNLQRAVQDVRDAQKRIHGEIEAVKRDNAKKIDTINKQIANMERNRMRKNLASASRVSVAAEEQTLQAQVSQISRDTELYVSQRDQEIRMFEGQANQFQNLASQLNTIA